MKKIPFFGVGTGIILGVVIGSIIEKVGLCIAIGIIFDATFSSENNTDKESTDKKKIKEISRVVFPLGFISGMTNN